MPTFWPSIRVSTDHQENGLEAQRQQLLAYYEYRMKPQGFALGKVHCDDDVSGFKPFLERPAAGQLMRIMETGDAIGFAKLDRAWRNVMDGLTIHAMLVKRGISIHLLDLNIDTTTDIGEAMLIVGLAFAQMERKRIVRRVKEAKAARRARGFYADRNPPAGWRWAPGGRPGNYRLIPDEEHRKVAAQLLQWYKNGWTVAQIERHLLYHPIILPERMWRLNKLTGKREQGDWHHFKIKNFIIRAAHWEKYGYGDKPPVVAPKFEGIHGYKVPAEERNGHATE